MSKKSKILLVSLAIASLASVRCTKKQNMQINEIQNLAMVCDDVKIPPAPPHEMFDAVDLCFGEYECPLDIKYKIAKWVYELSIWAKEANECAIQVKGAYKDMVEKK